MVLRFIIIEPKYSKSEPAIFISVGVLRRRLLQQRLRLLQIARIETFGEPAVNRGEQFARFHRLTPVTPEPRHAHRRAQLPGFCLLLARHREGALEIRRRFRRQCDEPRPQTTFPWFSRSLFSLRQQSAKRHRTCQVRRSLSSNMIRTMAATMLLPLIGTRRARK